MQGRSSWMSDIVCTISIAQAVGMACSMVPPTSSQAMIVRMGRIRLPPAISEYLIDSLTTSGYCCGVDASRAFSTTAARSIMYFLKLKWVLTLSTVSAAVAKT